MSLDSRVAICTYWTSIGRNIIIAVLVLDFTFILNYCSLRNIRGWKYSCEKKFMVKIFILAGYRQKYFNTEDFYAVVFELFTSIETFNNYM